MSISKFSLEWVDLVNFKSYKGRHKFTFPAQPGLYSITGKNLVNPRLGANGVGKSSLLDAVFWCLYGRTPRGLRAGDVICHGEHTAQVEVCFSVSRDDCHAITRRQAPNSLQLNGKDISQEALTETLRLTAEQFCYAVLMPQFGTAFFDLAPAAKLALFSQIMGLDFWLDKSVSAEIEARSLAKDIEAREHQVSKQEGQFEALEADLTRLEAQDGDFEFKRNTAIEALKAELGSHTDPELPRIIAGLEAKATKVAQKQQTATASWQKHNTARILAENDVAHTAEAIENLDELGAKCPICLQTVSGDHLKAQKRRLGTHLTEAKTAVQAALAHCEASQAELKGFERDAAAIAKNIADFTRKRDQLAQLHASLKLQIATETKRENPYSKLLSDKFDQLAELETSLNLLLNGLDDLKTQHAAAEFWVSGFKLVRLFIIDETLRQFEIEVNNNLASLGLPDWRIEFDIERETKSGGVSKGFVVLVHPPGSDEPVRLEAWSGGETQRLRLAGNLGLANLIMDRAGLRGTLEIFDEPSSHLSQEGLLDLLDTLQQRAQDHAKTIIIVDHHSLDYAFDGTFKVIKDKDGSHIEEGQ